MNKNSIILIILVLSACTKKVDKGSETFIPYFSDTSENKLTGAELTSIRLMDSITVVTEEDSVNFPNVSKIMSPDRYEIFTPKPGKQENSSCVGWALGYGLLSQQQLALSQLSSYDYFNSIYSPTFIYNLVNGGNDNGLASIGIGLNVLKNRGSCKWNTMNGSVLYNVFPQSNAFVEASNFKIDNFSRMIYSENRVKFYLLRNYVLPFAASVDGGFKSGKVKESFRKTSDGRLVWNKVFGNQKSGHAMLLCGYDDNIRAFKVLNSWGESWGNNGFIWIDYDLFPQVLMGAIPRQELFIAIPKRLDITQGLIAYYPFNGNAQDESGNSNHGTVYGASLVADRKGVINNAYNFNGINSYIQVPNSTSLNQTGAISISVWINCVDLSKSQRIFDKTTVSYSDAYMLDIHPANQLRFIVANPSAGANPPQSNAVLTQNNTWYHLVAVYDGSKVSFYVNGSLVNDFTISGISTVNTNPIRIGANSLLNGNWFNGKIDDIKLYNRKLSSAEVIMLYNE